MIKYCEMIKSPKIGILFHFIFIRSGSNITCKISSLICQYLVAWLIEITERHWFLLAFDIWNIVLSDNCICENFRSRSVIYNSWDGKTKVSVLQKEKVSPKDSTCEIGNYIWIDGLLLFFDFNRKLVSLVY